MLDRLPSSKFYEWMAYYNLEPWGTEREDWRSAMLATTIANYSGRIKQPKRISDFMPRQRTFQTVSQQLHNAKLAFGE